MTDWSKTLIRSSAAGYLFTEPQAKADKEAGNLSKTAQNYLIKTYIKEKYGREQDIVTKQMLKGVEGEEFSIEMLSKHQNKALKKNEIWLSNEFISGTPDIFVGDDINKSEYLYDIKTSWNIWTFLDNLTGKLDPIYYYQMQCYLWLCNCTHGAIAYVLADAPENLIESEKRSLLYKMNVATEIAPEFIEASAKLEVNMIYPDIPIEEKILLFPVERDDEVIEKLKLKVEKAREFLAEFEEKHLKFNVGKIVLPC